AADERTAAMREGSVRICKEWQQIDGLTFLIESVPFQEIQPYLQKLPAHQAAIKVNPKQRKEFIAQVRERRSDRALAAAKAQGVDKFSQSAIARAAPRPGKPVFLADYAILSSQTNFTFAGDTTYFVTNQVYLSAATLIEGGSVIKYDWGNQPIVHITG